MGKFDGVLFLSDFDGTYLDSEGKQLPENIDAVRYFMSQGGKFTICTGRTYPVFAEQFQKMQVPVNAPIIVCNGGMIVDLEKDEILFQQPYDFDVKQIARMVHEIEPDVGIELHCGKTDYIIHNSTASDYHMSFTGGKPIYCDINSAPDVINKIVFTDKNHERLERVKKMVLNSEYADCVEINFGHSYFLDTLPVGLNKGNGALKLAEILGVKTDDLYGAGDYYIDVPLLAVSKIGFVPENAPDDIRALGYRIVRHCDHASVAHCIEILDGLYA